MRGIVHIGWTAAATFAGLAVSACFSGEGTLGSVCAVDADCGDGQTCKNEICGRCGDGLAERGEQCLSEVQRVDLGADPVLVRALDVDRDAVLDFVTLSPGTPQLSVSRGSVTGLGDPERVALPIAAQIFAVGDLDGDTTADALVADAASLHWGPGSGTLVFSFGGDGLAWEGATALQIAAPRPGPGSDPSLAFGVASRVLPGGQTEVAALEVASDGALRIGAVVTMAGPQRPMAAGQLTGDEALEVLVVGGATVTVLSGPELEEVATLEFAADVRAVSLADVTGDGIADLLTADAEGALVVDAGTLGGGLARRPPLAMAGPVQALAVGDLDRDGDLELVGASEVAGVTVQLGLGLRWGDTITLAGVGAASDVYVVSLGGDVLPELVVSSATEGALWLLQVRP